MFQHCADFGIDVEWADLGRYRRGEYDWLEDRIVLSLRLTRAQATATLAHELGHQRFGDRCSSRAGERRAWEYGAAFLIRPDQYAAAEDLVGHHTAALAIELGDAEVDRGVASMVGDPRPPVARAVRATRCLTVGLGVRNGSVRPCGSR